MDTVKAVIDVGTNSIKFHAAKKKADGSLETVLDKNDIARLGEGLRETGLIAPEALERNALSVAAFAEKAKELGAVPEIVGTMALRTAKNAADFASRVKELTGLDVRIIPGEEEARLSYLAVLSGLPLAGGELVTFDTGGGSTEFVYGRGTEMVRKFSIPLGAVRITEEFFADDPVRPGSVDAAVKEIRSSLTGGGVLGSPEVIVGMGGTVTSLASVKFKMETYDPDVVQGSVLTLAELKDMAAMFASMTLEERKGVTGLQPKRADVILAGTCIVCAILELLGASSFTVSDRGLRHGLAYELFNQ
ncbi:Ppx/GppA phosphatase [Aminivibrio pyruvatiphilus]|jgi:exopolyphosphatase/guanosine-5'-triphosphate,3'-diphosphate pyrophosphatase|uniref:Ppx/GppA phosphatase n=1 Tax=Aminivibrio pyruvatiphilus TaxID=1005740 RepID=A0A4R8MCV2_9BACT|nr:Ppx/GppA phosphatase family protein [Aminivibrio pyruvatiphilus]TDY61695.1 Ppx/GppA phosphatase [Aminivibrio pyruvatiphilus]